MKIIEQTDGLYTIEADRGKKLVNIHNNIVCRRAIDQDEKDLGNWKEE